MGCRTRHGQATHAHMFMLPRALALYSRKADAKAHEAHCGKRLCLIPEALLRAREKNVAFSTSRLAVSAPRSRLACV